MQQTGDVMPDGASPRRTTLQRIRDSYRQRRESLIRYWYPAGPDPRVGTAAALIEEFEAILEDSEHGAADRPARSGMGDREARLWNAPRAALCLSGGGIRSAAFSLGVLQSLARAEILLDFHYLSTVSGGGYTGAWLAAVMKHGGGLQAAQDALTIPGDTRLEGLRAFTNFLTPSPGPASADTRAGVVLWLRNVLLNWLVFGPAMLAVALVPALYAALLATGATAPVGYAAGIVGLLALLYATLSACRDIPSHGFRSPPPNDTEQSAGASALAVHLGIVTPVLVWALLGPVAFAALAHPVLRGEALPPLTWPPWQTGDLWLSGGALAALLAGYLLAWLSLDRERRPGFASNAGWWVLASIIAAALLQLGMWLGRSLPLKLLAVLGPLWVIGAHVLQSSVYVGVRSASRYADLDREWLARLNGDKLAPTLVWSALAAVTLLLPCYVGNSSLSKLTPLLTGPAAAWLASSTKSLFGRKTPPDSGLSWLMPVLVETAISLAALVFAATLLMLLAKAGERLSCLAWQAHPTLALLGFSIGGGMLAYGLGERVNVNRFSLHGVYRNRLVRAFLGTARLDGRTVDAYTGFDPGDNLRMADLYDKAAPRRRLFPVINTTLNLTVSKRTAWSERKAAPFTVTPLRSGADCLFLPTGTKGVFVKTETYAGGETEGGAEDSERKGFTLGGAMTISGAAVSPNMGYHTRPGVAFLMTLFDVRLGAWLPNPAKTADPTRLNRGRPTNALFAFAAEMLGRADDQRDNVYLSDGGHFDNLGLYEMLRRECRRIVVVDAGEDGGYAYGDAGDSLRRAAIDFGATITFSPALVGGVATLRRAGAYASIRYRSGAEGELIYLKPWQPSDMPADVMAYAAAHAAFPHESTTDQFFTESQFESYRQLGSFIGTTALTQAGSLAQWFWAARPQQSG
jgi:predicted acylesterase/phospholipase RssA